MIESSLISLRKVLDSEAFNFEDIRFSLKNKLALKSKDLEISFTGFGDSRIFESVFANLGICETGNIVNRFITNVASNTRFYSIKMILDFLSETKLLRNTWSNTKHNNFVLILLMGTALPELLTSFETAPLNYRAFLARYFTVRRTNNFTIDTNDGFCKQCHRYPDNMSTLSGDVSKTHCSGSLYGCIKCNITMFGKNLKLFCKLYGKLYGLGYIITFITAKNKLAYMYAYIKDVVRSSFAMSLMYFLIHTYLTIIDRKQPPQKIHYNIGLVIGSIPLLLLETKYRLGCINQFMMSIYANTLMYYSTPKNDTFWKFVMYFMIVCSLMCRGCKRTVRSLI